jgi:hypothetical protein
MAGPKGDSPVERTYVHPTLAAALAKRGFGPVEVRHALVLRESDVKNLWKALEEGFSSVTASARCADKLRRQFANRDELINYPNPRSKCIQELCIAARSRGSQADVLLGGKTLSTATVEIEDENTKPLHIHGKLADILDGMTPWYSFAARLNLAYAGIILYFLLAVTLAFWVSKKTEHKAISLSVDAKSIAIGVLIVAGLAGLVWGYVRFHKYFFPSVSFNIGQGVERYKLGEKVRWVVTASVISVLACIVGFIMQTM